VSRFGPCPTENQLGIFTGSQFGCIDHTPVPGGPPKAHSADEVGLGYRRRHGTCSATCSTTAQCGCSTTAS
jgi:hypothetical protein